MALHVLDEANRCLGCKKPMCQQGCPIHTNIPEVIRLLKANELDAAGRMLFENNPLTTVCSLVCNHENQCEGDIGICISLFPFIYRWSRNTQIICHLFLC